MHQTITDDLAVLLLALPPHLATMVAEHPQRMELIEIVMDLGRAPEARFPSGDSQTTQPSYCSSMSG